MLSSQARTVMVWFTGAKKISYIIPLYSGLEASLGSQLEVELDLSQSYSYQQQYKRIAKVHPNTALLNLPRFQTPLDLILTANKRPHKTILTVKELSPSAIEQSPQQPCIDKLS